MINGIGNKKGILCRCINSSSSTKGKQASRMTLGSSNGMTIAILGNVAYASLASGFLCNDLLSLRLLLICGYSGLVTYHALRPKPLWIPLSWSAFFVIVNVSMATLLILDQMPPTLSELQKELHIQNFAPLSSKQFKALMDIGERVTYEDGALLTQANEPCQKLFFIVRGKATMLSANGKLLSKLQRGGFPNCMSFQRSGWDSVRFPLSVSYGTIKCEGEMECIVWDSQHLFDLMDEDFKLRMDHVVIEAAIRRLLVDSEGANVKDYIRVISEGWADKAVQQQKIQSMATRPNPPTK